MPKMVCVNDSTELRPEENGVFVIEMASFGPYKIWSADLWKCPVCEYQIAAGFGNSPLMEHYEEGFDALLGRIRNGDTKVVYDNEK